VDLRLAPLRPHRCADGELRPWYAAEPGLRPQFVLLDGPPARRGGRAAALFALWKHLAGDWEV
jgi:hypothetical protein